MAAPTKTILEADGKPAPLEEHWVAQQFREAADAQGLSEELRLEANLDRFAFDFTSDVGAMSEWGTFFGPIMTMVDEKKGRLEYPPKKAITGNAILQWRDRAASLNHPVLVARYADLAWDFAREGGEKPVVDDARRACDAYLKSAGAPFREEIGNFLPAAIRALNIAIQLKDVPRIDAARRRLLALHTQVMNEKNGWYDVVPTRLLLAEPGARMTVAETEDLVASLEGLVKHLGDTGNKKAFNPHSLQDMAEHLIRYYHRNDRIADVKRLRECVARGFEYAAKLAEPFLASAFLQTSVAEFKKAGLPDESARVRTAMEQALVASQSAMKTISTEVKVPIEDMEAVIASAVLESPGDTFVKIAASYLPSAAKIEERLKNLAKKAPLQAHIPQHILEGNQVAGIIGGLHEDLPGRLIHQASIEMALSEIWLMEVFDRAIERHQFTPLDFAIFANRHALFNDMGFLIKGLGAWFSRDLGSALHLLVPQVETAFRAIAVSLGQPATKPHPVIKKVSVARNLGDILADEEIVAAIGPDITLHFKALYSDPRGKNLRNRVAHGTLPAEELGPHTVRQIVHSLLVLGVWKELAESRRSKKATAPQAVEHPSQPSSEPPAP